MNTKHDLLKDMWASLGIAFSGLRSINANPEDAIIACIQSGEFPDDKKMMSLMLLWISEYSSLVRIECLKILMKSLGPFEAALLGGIALKALKWGDGRWDAIVGEARTLVETKSNDFEKRDPPYRVRPPAVRDLIPT